MLVGIEYFTEVRQINGEIFFSADFRSTDDYFADVQNTLPKETHWGAWRDMVIRSTGLSTN